MASSARVLALFSDAEVEEICALLDRGASRREAIVTVINAEEQVSESVQATPAPLVDGTGPHDSSHHGDCH